MAAPRLWSVRIKYSNVGEYTGGTFAGSQLDWFGANDMAGFRPPMAHLGYKVLVNGVWTPFTGSPRTQLNNVWNASPRMLGMLDMLWQDGSAPSNNINVNYAAILAGTWDTQLTQFANDAKAWLHPFIMRIFHEPNLHSASPQFPWQIGTQQWGTSATWTNTTTQYQQALAHIINIFHNAGCWNVTWCMCLNIQSATSSQPSFAAYSNFWPGNDSNGRPYVDIIGMDGYNDIPSQGANLTWAKLFRGPTFGTTWLQDSYAHAAALHPTLPLMVNETETSGYSAGVLDRNLRVTYYNDALSAPNKSIITNTPRIYFISWFKDYYDVMHWNPDADQTQAAAVDVVAFKNGKSTTGDWQAAATLPTPADSTPLQPLAVTAPTFTVTQPTGTAITSNSVTINWTTTNAAHEPQPTTTWLKYGTTTAYGSTTAVTDTSPQVGTHTVTVSGLTAGTTYHFQAQGTDGWGNVGSSADIVVATTGSDYYQSTESGITGANLVLKLGDASKAAAAVAADSSGNALNGTYNGTTGVNAAGIPGTSDTAFQTDGTDYVLVPDAALLSPQVAGKIWISVWFFLNATPAAAMCLVCKGGGAANQWEYEVTLDATQGVLGIIFQLTGGTAISFDGTSILPVVGAWNKVDLAFDSTLANGTTDKLIMYFNGERQGGATTVTGTIADGTSGLYVGRRGDASKPAGTVAAPIVIDEVRIRNIYPTYTQIRQLWFAGLNLRTTGVLSSGD